MRITFNGGTGMSEKKYIDVDLLKNEICKNKIMSRELIAQRILHIIDEQIIKALEEREDV